MFWLSLATLKKHADEKVNRANTGRVKQKEGLRGKPVHVVTVGKGKARCKHESSF